jgi:hypothetical protein
LTVETKLTQGMSSIISDADSELSQYKWHSNKYGTYRITFYAERKEGECMGCIRVKPVRVKPFLAAVRRRAFYCHEGP